MGFISFVMLILFIISIIILFNSVRDGKSILALIFILSLLFFNANKAESYKSDVNYYEDVIKNMIVTQDINVSKLDKVKYKKTIISLKSEVEKEKLSADSNSTK